MSAVPDHRVPESIPWQRLITTIAVALVRCDPQEAGAASKAETIAEALLRQGLIRLDDQDTRTNTC